MWSLLCYSTLIIVKDNIFITNSDLNRPSFAWHPNGKLGLFKTEIVIVMYYIALVTHTGSAHNVLQFVCIEPVTISRPIQESLHL